MSTPTVIELPRRLEPTTRDTFLDDHADWRDRGTAARELSRPSNGVDMRLVWSESARAQVA
jgi:hypothetical protein